MRRLLKFLSVLLIMAGLIPGAPFPALPVSADATTAHILLSAYSSLDPVSLGRDDSSARTIDENLFVGLTRYDTAANQVQKVLASNWTVSDDGLTWTFTLRNDVEWVAYNPGSGQVQAIRPVVAGDFVYAIRRACQPTAPFPAAHTNYIVSGCRTIATANPQFIDDVFMARELAVNALSDQTLEIKLEIADPHFDMLLSLPEFRPVPREAIAKGTDWTKPDTIITDGPYALADSSSDGQSMTLVRNSLWPDKPSGNVERVAITFGASADSITQQLTAGSADYATLDAASAAALQKAKADLLKSAPGNSVTVLGFSSERPGITKEAFRRALSLALNRDALVNATLSGLALSTSRFTPPGVLAGPATPPDNSGYDLNAAKAAMSDAGVKSCILSGKLFLIVEDTPQNTAIGQNLIDQWRTAFGCGPDVFSLLKDTAEHVSNVAGGMINTYDTNSNPRPDLWLYTWTPDYPDANAWTGDALHCEYGFLKSGLDCAAADGLVDKAFTEPDNAQRASDYAEAETDWFGPAGTFPVAPLYVWLAFAGQQPWLNGATVTGPQYFANWSLAAH